MFKVFGLAALTLAAAPTLAQAPSEQPRRAVVRTADLDLGSHAGRTELDRRLAAAVRRVCPKPKTSDLPSWRDRASCLDRAGRSADAQRDLTLASRAQGRVEIVSVAR